MSAADIDGDGQADIAYAVKDSAGRRTHRYWLSNAGVLTGDGLADVVAGRRAPFRFGGNLDSSGGYVSDTEALNPWFVDLDGDGRSEMMVPASTAAPLGTQRRFTYVVYRHGEAGPQLLDGGALPGAPTATLAGFGGPVRVITPPVYLPNLFVLPIDRNGEGRPLLAVLRDNRELYPPAAPDAESEAWYCSSSDCGTGESKVVCDGTRTREIMCAAGPVEQAVICQQILTPRCTGCSERGCHCRQRDCGDAPGVRRVDFVWEHRSRTGEVVSSPPPEVSFDPDVRKTAVAADDPEGDGTQILAKMDVEVPRADVNGDGLVDSAGLLSTGGGGWRTPGARVPSGRNFRPLDYDGDGRTDFLMVAPGVSDRRMVLHRWTDEGYVQQPIGIEAGHFANPPFVLSHRYHCQVSESPYGAYIDDVPACGIFSDRTYCLWRNSGSLADAQIIHDRHRNATQMLRTIVWGCVPHGGLSERRPDQEYRTTQVLDWNGDGLTDVITVDAARRLMLYVRKGRKADVLTRIEDGFGSSSTVEYASIADPRQPTVDIPRVYSPGGVGCEYPLRCLKAGVWVVRRVVRDTGTAIPAELIHSYADARVDIRGRRALGFRRHAVTRRVDVPKPPEPASTATRFWETVDSDRAYSFIEDAGVYPLAGFVTSVRTSITATGSGLTAGTYRIVTPEIVRGVGGTDPGSPAAPRYTLPGTNVEVIDHASNRHVYFVHPLRVAETEYEARGPELFAPGAEKRTTVAETWRDLYANTTRQQTWVHASPGRGTPVPAEALLYRDSRQIFDGDDRAPGATFDEARFLRFSRRSTHAESLNGQPAVVRTTSQAFDLQRATTDGTTVEPDGSVDERLATTTIYSAHGLPVAATEAAGGTHRITRTVYDDLEFMYPAKVVNPAGHEVTSVFVPGLERVAWRRDPNGRIVRSRHDGFGRIRLSDGPVDADVSTSYTLSAEGLPRVVTSASAGAVTTTDHDRLGRPVRRERRTFDGGAAEDRTEYDPLGRVRRVVEPYGGSVFVYDETGRLTKELRTNPVLPPEFGPQPWKEHRYDDHFRTTTFDAGRRESYAVTDGLGQLVERGEQIEDRTVTTLYEYKPFGLLWKTHHGPEAA